MSNSSLWTIDMTVADATTPDQSEIRNDDIERGGVDNNYGMQ